MIHLTSETSILLAIHPVDFRKGIDGFVSLCQYKLKQSPRSGTLFVFINRRKTMIRILSYEFNGYWLMTKRLSKGRYNWPKSNGDLSRIRAVELRKYLMSL